MPLGFGSFTGARSFGRVRRRARAASKRFNISPSVDGKSVWDLNADGDLELTGAGTTYTITPVGDFIANVHMWGGGGGSVNYAADGFGGGGGASYGDINFSDSTPYQAIVGGAGAGSPANRDAGGGAGGTGIELTSGSVAIMVAGGGGGGYSPARAAGAGGGETGQTGGPPAFGGLGGTQVAAGVGRSGGRRTGRSGSGRNGGGGGTGPIVNPGGVGFGNGGGGAINPGDAGSGGGGGGFWGGAEGGGDAGGSAGGGGSGHVNPTYVTNGATIQGNLGIQALSSNPLNGGYGAGGIGASNGQPGKIVIRANPL